MGAETSKHENMTIRTGRGNKMFRWSRSTFRMARVFGHWPFLTLFMASNGLQVFRKRYLLQVGWKLFTIQKLRTYYQIIHTIRTDVTVLGVQFHDFIYWATKKTLRILKFQDIINCIFRAYCYYSRMTFSIYLLAVRVRNTATCNTKTNFT